MAIADKTTFWQLRMEEQTTVQNGNGLIAFSASGTGSVSGSAWRITNQTLSHTPTSNAYTLWAMIKYTTTPNTNGF